MKAVTMAKIPSILKAKKTHVSHISQLCQLTKRFMAAPYSTLVGYPLMAADWKKDQRTTATTSQTKLIYMRPPTATQIMGFSICILQQNDASASKVLSCIEAFGEEDNSSDQIQNKESSSVGNCNRNPCLDLYYNQANEEANDEDLCIRLKKLLPLAWSHNPLTTLKLILNLQEQRQRLHGNTFNGRKAFYKAAFWLHKNHPKTLASNLASIVGRPFGSLNHPVQILNLLLEGQGASSSAVEMYECDQNYKLLHDQVSDLFVECLKSDIEKLKKHKLKQSAINDDDDDGDDDYEPYCSQITEAADCCLHESSSKDFLCESIARKIFPRESYPEEVDEADYAKRVRERLREEVLEPLSKAFTYSIRDDPGKDNYVAAEKYLEEVKAGKSKIAVDSLLPHEIVGYVNHWNFGKVAELQWKAMLEDKLKQGKLMKNCLAVCDLNYLRLMGTREIEVSLSLQVLMSELSEEPWKGKVIDFPKENNFGESYKLHLIPLPGNELRHKCDFVRRRTMDWYSSIYIQKVLDLILEEAVSRNLKPDQMIKKVFLFTGYSKFEQCLDAWDTKWDYEAIQSKFKEKGYENAIPHIVFWRFNGTMPSTEPGVTMVGGSSDDLIKLLLDSDGEIGPDLVMEADIAGKEYQKLVVVD